MDNAFDILIGLLDKKRPILSKVLKSNKNVTLGEYVDSFKNIARNSIGFKTIQNKSDFIEISVKKAKELYGNERAVKLKERLKLPSIFTAAHTGLLFNCIPVQGTLIFALSEMNSEIVPTYTFGDIPLNNTTYPRGVSLSNSVKIPLFPDRLKNSLAAYCAGYKSEDVKNAKMRTEQLFKDGKISEKHTFTVNELIEKIFALDDILKSSSLSDQASRINIRLWKYLFADSVRDKIPELVNLQIEDIVNELIIKDIQNKDSLIFNMFLNDKLRGSIVQFLDGVYGAWTTSIDSAVISGTMFFWGVDDKGRAVSLYLKDGLNGIVLTGTDISGNNLVIPFTLEGIINGLKQKKILPGLFVTFSAIAFARGILCYGGFMQTDYLANMKEGLLRALKTAEKKDWIEYIENIKTDNYCNGFEAIIQQYPDEALHSAGAVEIIASGGLSMNDIEKIRNLNVIDTTLAGFIERLDLIYKSDERAALQSIDLNKTLRELSKQMIVLH